MRRWAVLAVVVIAGVAIYVSVRALIGRRSGPPVPTRRQPAATRCSVTLRPGADVAQAIVTADDGETICLEGGSYARIDVSNAHHGGYVTVAPAPGAVAVVDGVQTSADTFLRFRGLTMTAGFDLVGPGAASHDLQFIDNDIGHTTYGIVVNGAGAPIRNVLIQGNSIHDLDFSGPSPGYAGGQGVTVYWGSYITVRDNAFWANSWHYIQCGSCDHMAVEHNLFTGPSNAHPGAHLNVWQIWQGGSGDSFTDNAVIGAPGAPIADGAILWETGPGGATLSDSYSDMTVSDNLFVDEDSTTTLDLAASSGLTVTDNTIVGSGYGLLVRGRCTCAAGFDRPGTGYDISGNIVVADANPGARFRVLCPASGACGDGNVSDDGSARSAFPGAARWVTDWSPRWVTTQWDASRLATPPAGYYEPVGLGIDAGARAGTAP